MALRLIPCQACQDCWWIETLCLLPTCGLSFLQTRYTQSYKCLALGTIHNTKPSNRQQVSQAATRQGLSIVSREQKQSLGQISRWDHSCFSDVNWMIWNRKALAYIPATITSNQIHWWSLTTKEKLDNKRRAASL
jgi:hypothetical protein